MAAARHLPKPETVWPITFDYNGSTMAVSYPALKGVQNGDEVTFENQSASAALNFTFNPNPTGVTNPPGAKLFNNITNLAAGNSNQQSPQNANGSVNYFVQVVGGPTFGPYAIQVGNGPIYIQITNSDSQPDPIKIPMGGTLEMYSNDTNTYEIKWGAAFNPFPGLSEAYPGPGSNSIYTQQGPANTYGYEFNVKNVAGVGKGTVVVT